MAEAYGKLTGRPGVALVTRGPAASNAAVGIHTRRRISTPMIVLVGQSGSDAVDREAFQEIDDRRMYGSVAKWAAQIDRADRIPEVPGARVRHRAMSGRPGPVALALPRGPARRVGGRARPATGGVGRRLRPAARGCRAGARLRPARAGRW